MKSKKKNWGGGVEGGSGGGVGLRRGRVEGGSGWM